MRHRAGLRTADFSPDGTRVVTVSGPAEESGYAQAWDAVTGRAVGEPMRSDGQVYDARFSPDGSRVITVGASPRVPLTSGIVGGGSRAQVWSAATGEPVGGPLYHVSDIYRAGFNVECTRIVTASLDGIRIWDATSSQPPGEPILVEEGAETSSFSPDGRKAVVTSDETARLWDVETGRGIGMPLRHEYSVGRGIFSPDGTKLVTMREDVGIPGYARLWDASKGQPLGGPLRHDEILGYVNNARFNPSGTLVVTSGEDKTARIWDALTGQSLGAPLRHESSVRDASFSPDGTRVVTVSHPNVRIWKLNHEQIPELFLSLDAEVWTAGFSPDGTKVLTVNRDDTVRIWDAATGQMIGGPLTHGGQVYSAVFSPDGAMILTACADGSARTWNALTSKMIGRPLRHEGQVSCVNFSADGTRIVTASDDHTLRVWDALAGQTLGEPMIHDLWVDDARFSPDGTKILAGSGFGPPRVWRILTTKDSETIPMVTPQILAWAQSFSGFRFTEEEELEVIPEGERLAGITTHGLPPGPWADLATWINTPAPLRTIDPKSSVTLRQIAERKRDFDGEGTVKSFEAALFYDTTVPLARLFLGVALEREDAGKPEEQRDAGVPQRAAFLRRFSLEGLQREKGKMPDDKLAALWLRAARHLAELPAERKVGIGPKEAAVRDEAVKAARKALELAPGLPEAEELLKSLAP
jgi:WD40 repeat protein